MMELKGLESEKLVHKERIPKQRRPRDPQIGG